MPAMSSSLVSIVSKDSACSAHACASVITLGHRRGCLGIRGDDDEVADHRRDDYASAPLRRSGEAGADLLGDRQVGGPFEGEERHRVGVREEVGDLRSLEEHVERYNRCSRLQDARVDDGEPREVRAHQRDLKPGLTPLLPAGWRHGSRRDPGRRS